MLNETYPEGADQIHADLVRLLEHANANAKTSSWPSMLMVIIGKIAERNPQVCAELWVLNVYRGLGN